MNQILGSPRTSFVVPSSQASYRVPGAQGGEASAAQPSQGRAAQWLLPPPGWKAERAERARLASELRRKS